MRGFSKVGPFVDKLKRLPLSRLSTNSVMLPIVIVGFVAIGGFLIWRSYAATAVVAVQPEAGTVTAPAVKVSDTNASGGQAVKFAAPPATTPPSGDKLTWAPPSGWQNYPVKNVTSSGQTIINGGGGDVRVVLPKTGSAGAIKLTNCRNVVIMGGALKARAVSKDSDGQDQRLIYVQGCTGIVHIEGVYFEGNVAGSETDAIAASAPSATIQMQNIYINRIRGSQDGNHADMFQPWGGVKAYRVDRFTGYSNYQGFKPVLPTSSSKTIGSGYVKRTNLNGHSDAVSSKGGYLWWHPCPTSGYKTHPITLDRVFIKPRPGRSFELSAWKCGGSVTNNAWSWPSSHQVTGKIQNGTNVADFVKPSDVGPGYVSPGYL